MHFGQIFKPCGNHYFAQIAYIFIHFCKGFKNNHFWQLLYAFVNFLLLVTLAAKRSKNEAGGKKCLSRNGVDVVFARDDEIRLWTDKEEKSKQDFPLKNRRENFPRFEI